MPELARGEWEHLFEPWFAPEPQHSASTPATAAHERESLFREASQPLAVRRKDYIRRQSPISRSLEERSANVAAAFERLVAFTERRHFGVERTDDDALVAPASARVVLLRPSSGSAVSAKAVAEAATPDVDFGDGSEGRARSHTSPGPLRALLAFASIALIVLYVVYVQRSAEAAMSRATAAERTATEVQRSAQDAVAAAADRAQRAITHALTQATRAERMIDVMAAPDARRIELSGRGDALAAVGQALYSRSRGVILSATDLPRPPAGQAFQVWATTPTGPVSLGVVTPDAQGRLATAYELPSDLAGSIRSFVVTQEPAGGSATPGAPVLANR